MPLPAYTLAVHLDALANLFGSTSLDSRQMDHVRSMAEAALIPYIGDLSQHFYCAGWLIDFEYILWGAHRDRTKTIGLVGLHLSDEEHFALRVLTRLSGKWAYRNEETSDVELIAHAEWVPLFDAHQEKLRKWLKAYHAKMDACAADGGHDWAPHMLGGRICGCGAEERAGAS